ncbi:metalloprotease PmbA [Azospira oryzae]|uniref:metalloprotease PmbA n=1 Tax=Azospira oryzae TaxID=146939 RepID=UPI00196692E5|nr:metalloprotease PmbA [Azospira oryzae]
MATKALPKPSRTTAAATSGRFSLPLADLLQLARDTVALATRGGASAAEVDVSEGFGQSVSVRQGEVETIEYNRDKGIGVTVYLGQRKGYASTSDFSRQALAQTVDAALAIARYTAEDPCAGLPEKALLAKQWQDPQLYYPWQLSVEGAIDLARRCEDAAFAVSPLVKNSEGATVSLQEGQFATANSLGFAGGYPSSRHYIACSVIAGKKGRNAEMQRDDWYSTHRDPADFPAPESIGDYAARRALSRLGGRKVKTCEVPVIFEAPIASGLLGNFVYAASGGSLYRKASFLVDSLGKRIFAPGINISERPDLPKGLASGPFDNDGVATRSRQVVSDGVLNGYFLSVYTARKLGMTTTGNAGGCHNLVLEPGREDLAGLIRQVKRGLLVTELLGQGVNYVNGDYSRGAAGYWIENGEIAYPVEEITIAGNLKEMFMNIAGVGNDVVVRGSKQTGSILIQRMTVAGA